MKRARQGSILILALWVLFFLASLTVAAAGHVWAVLQAAERLQGRAVARMEAGSAVAWAVSAIEAQFDETSAEDPLWDGVSHDAWNRDRTRLALPVESLAPPEDRIHFIMPGEEDRYTGVIGEEGRLHLNLANPERLKALLQYVAGESGEQLGNLLFGRSHAEEAGLTGEAREGYARPDYRAVEELLLVDGVDAALFEKIAPHVTVYGAGRLINVNSASRAVLVAFLRSTGEPDMVEHAEAIADEIITARREQGFTQREDFLARMPQLPGGLLGRGLSFSSTAFRGFASGVGATGAETGLVIEFVWDTVSKKYVLWRER